MKTTACDICKKLEPEVRAHAVQTTVQKVKYLWTERVLHTRQYDICTECWAKILNRITPLDKKGRRHDTR
jgi:hypothetical protein